MNKSYPSLFQFHRANRRKLGNAAIKSFPMQSIRKLISTRFTSEIDDERVLRDEAVGDEWAEREEIAELVECQEEAVDCLLSRGGWFVAIIFDNSME